jgi:hypothetical protein
MPYTTATIKQKDTTLPDGRTRLVITLSGGGEPVKDVEYYADGTTTGPILRDYVIGQANRAVAASTFLATLTPGVSTVSLTPVAPPGPTAGEIWAEKVRRYGRLIDLGVVTGALNTDITALKADIQSTYQAGFLTGV